MHLFPPELDIAPDEGFTPEKDIFGRKEFADQLTRVVRALEDPTVLLLDGKWGTGKTVFIKMWLGELRKLDVPTIYFDAFANDYHEDAFLTLAGEIVAKAEQLNPRRQATLDKFKVGAFQVAKALGRASIKIGIRAASAGLLSGEELTAGLKITTDAARVVGDETAKAVDDLIKERLDSHSADKEAFERFKEALTALAVALNETESNDAGTVSKENLIFVIDELDRCRPSFSLELLEKIKHFFAVPRVIFVLASSREQLEQAVKFSYGDIDCRTYLEKFYHLRMSFPAGRRDRPDGSVAKYLGHLLAEIPPGSTDYGFVISMMAAVRPLSLRTLERVYSYLKIVTMSMRQGSAFFPEVISVLCLLKVIEPDLYDAARKGMLSFDALNAAVRFGHWRNPNSQEVDDHVSQRIAGIWRVILGEPNVDDQQRVQQDHRFATFRASGDVMTYYCELIDCFAFPG